MTDNDCWDIFGSDEETDDKVESYEPNSISSAIARYLSQHFSRENPQIQLSERAVCVLSDSQEERHALELRGMNVVETFECGSKFLDALVILNPRNANLCSYMEKLVPGGLLISTEKVRVDENKYFKQNELYNSGDFVMLTRTKRPIHIHHSTCPWLPATHSIKAEEERLYSAVITPSVSEITRGFLTDKKRETAIRCLQNYGYCVIRNLLDPAICSHWGQKVLESVHSAAEILLKRDNVDIYHPHTSESEPQSYREISMREDLRLDLRHGPELSTLRSQGDKGDEPIVVKGDVSEFNGFLRGNSDLLEIMRQVMNPKIEELSKGNIGRFNFDGGGANGSYQDLRLSPVGGIVSFPGCADQALHADTPHLFEHIPDLPAHYINIFAPGTPFHEKVGGTAFVHGSHNLHFTATKYGSRGNYEAVYPCLVRPCVSLGDVILFDCRVLHFGMANQSESTERVLLYSNATHVWFQDPKNWDDFRSIFHPNTESMEG